MGNKSSTGILGVRRSNVKNGYCVYLGKDYLGIYTTVEQAAQVLREAQEGKYPILRRGKGPRRTKRVKKNQFRGVTPYQNRWRACCVLLCDTEEEAARIYDKMAKVIYGDKAILNFPEEVGKD